MASATGAAEAEDRSQATEPTPAARPADPEPEGDGPSRFERVLARQRREPLASVPRRSRTKPPKRSTGARIVTGLKVFAASVVGIFVVLLIVGLTMSGPDGAVEGAGEGVFAAVDPSICAELDRALPDGPRFADVETGLDDVDIGEGEGFGAPIWAAQASGWVGSEPPLISRGSTGEVTVLAEDLSMTRTATVDVMTGAVTDERHLDALVLGAAGPVQWFVGMVDNTAMILAVEGRDHLACFAAGTGSDADAPPLSSSTPDGFEPNWNAQHRAAVHADRLHLVLEDTGGEATVQTLTTTGNVATTVLDEPVFGPPFADADHVYVRTYHLASDRVVALDAATLEPRWEQQLRTRAGGWAASRDAAILVATTMSSEGATVHLLDAGDGVESGRLDHGSAAHVAGVTGSHVLLADEGRPDQQAATIHLAPLDLDPAPGFVELSQPPLSALVRIVDRDAEVMVVSAPWWVDDAGARGLVIDDGQVIAWSEHPVVAVIEDVALLLVSDLGGTQPQRLVAVPMTDPPSSDGGGGGDGGDDADDTDDPDDPDDPDDTDDTDDSGATDETDDSDDGGGGGGGADQREGGDGGEQDIDIDEGWAP